PQLPLFFAVAVELVGDPNDDCAMSQSEAARIAGVLRLVEAGQLDNPPCAKCGDGTMSAWFTNPVVDRYFIWIVCNACAEHYHVNCNGRPTHFSEERRSEKFEEMDREMLRSVREVRDDRLTSR